MLQGEVLGPVTRDIPSQTVLDRLSRARPDSPPPSCRRHVFDMTWGGVRGGGNHDIRGSGFPPTLSLPHKGGGDPAATAAPNLDHQCTAKAAPAGRRMPVGSQQKGHCHEGCWEEAVGVEAPRRIAPLGSQGPRGRRPRHHGDAAGTGLRALRRGPDLRAAQARLPGAPHRHRRRLRPLVRAHHHGGRGRINEKGGIGGRRIEIVAEDDGTDPKRGAEVVEKFATQHKVDLAFGTLFSPRRDGLGAARRRAEAALLRGERGLSRRLGRAEPLHLPARHHRRALAGHLDGAVDGRQARQEGHHDLPRLRLRPRPPRLSSRPPSRSRAARSCS